MVMESDRAGTTVTCPNCKRTLRVPSGKDRGVELAPVPAAAKSRTSRQCPRCDKEVPVDSQICPHCKQILLDDAGQPAEAAPVATAAPVARPVMSRMAAIKGTASKGAKPGQYAQPAAKPGQPPQKTGFQIKYGGTRTGMAPSQRNAMMIGGGVLLALIIVAIIIIGVVGSSHSLQGARKQAN
jgi:endogenous inhibitor of DNA gyrase (YacG/DUF329 family)